MNKYINIFSKLTEILQNVKVFAQSRQGYSKSSYFLRENSKAKNYFRGMWKYSEKPLHLFLYNAATAIAIPWIFSENSQAKN